MQIPTTLWLHWDAQWWRNHIFINSSTLLHHQQQQHAIFYSLSAFYALISSVALIQLLRIQLRLPQYSWTTQKVFHLMNFFLNAVRAVVFGLHSLVFLLRPKVFILVLLDLPGLLFFSTYTLLVLFWAGIYHQARCLPTYKLRIVYLSINGALYFIQVCIWIYLGIDDNSVVEFIGKILIAAVSFMAALGFLLYGGRLFFMLRRFPIESKGRRKKLYEDFIFFLLLIAYSGSSLYITKVHERVGSVTAICFTCFLIRCVVGFLSAFDSDVSLEVLDHPILDLIYYMLVEILPSALVLYILRTLPPKRISAQYHPIH